VDLSTTVILPVRNGALFVGEAIRSALAQLDPADELLVIDDGSTDDTVSVVAAVADPRVHLLAAVRRGVSAARNYGLAVARGKFIAFLDHDDYWPADRHRLLLRVLLDRSDVDGVFGRIRIRCEPDAVSTERFTGFDGALAPITTVCCALYRRRILDLIGGFAEEMSMGEDTDFNMRLKKAGARFVWYEADALVYRRHAGNTTNDARAVRNSVFDLLRRRSATARSRVI
jgi:glycosyltransferase involved in cell wall biosynthesis